VVCDCGYNFAKKYNPREGAYIAANAPSTPPSRGQVAATAGKPNAPEIRPTATIVTSHAIERRQNANAPAATPNAGFSSADAQGCYGAGFAVTGFVTFVSCWIYCVSTYGFLIGVSIGWFPSAIAACVVGALWPLAVLVAIGAVILYGAALVLFR
jgi:hypothetical protein